MTAPVRAPHPAGVVEVCEGPFEQLAAAAWQPRPRAARIRRRLASTRIAPRPLVDPTLAGRDRAR